MDELTRIFNAAEMLFQKYGIRSVTMADLAQELGMSKKTLYLHIQNKDDLIEKALLRTIEEDKAHIDSAKQGAANALDELMLMNIEMQKKIQQINPLLIFDLKKYHPQAWAHMEAFQKEFIYSHVRANLERGIAEGIYRQDINPDILSKIYLGFFPVFTDYDLFPVHDYPRMDLHGEFMRYHLYGIVSEKGREWLKQLSLTE